jgi:hypothetical protein
MSLYVFENSWKSFAKYTLLRREKQTISVKVYYLNDFNYGF